MCITFDDGYADTCWAVHMLAGLGLCATVYVTTGSLDSPSGLSDAQLTALDRSESVQIRAHTVSHPHLDAVPADRISAEIRDSKQALESRLGHRVDSFAYPHGSFDRTVHQAVVDHGFLSAAAVKNALSHPRDDAWAVARLTITRLTSLQHVEAMLEGRCAPVAWRRERIRTKAARMRRRMVMRTSHPIVAAG